MCLSVCVNSKFLHRELQVMDLNLFDYNLVFGSEMKMNKVC